MADRSHAQARRRPRTRPSRAARARRRSEDPPLHRPDATGRCGRGSRSATGGVRLGVLAQPGAELAGPLGDRRAQRARARAARPRRASGRARSPASARCRRHRRQRGAVGEPACRRGPRAPSGRPAVRTRPRRCPPVARARRRRRGRPARAPLEDLVEHRPSGCGRRGRCARPRPSGRRCRVPVAAHAAEAVRLDHALGADASPRAREVLDLDQATLADRLLTAPTARPRRSGGRPGSGASQVAYPPNASSTLARTAASEVCASAATSGPIRSSASSSAFASSGESRAGRRNSSPYSSFSTAMRVVRRRSSA